MAGIQPLPTHVPSSLPATAILYKKQFLYGTQVADIDHEKQLLMP
jgi:hypothetical protein